MIWMELMLRTAAARATAKVRVKVTGSADAEGCVEVTCVEIITDDASQTILLSDERGE